MSPRQRIGLLFPGQGSQFVGMGRDLHERHPSVRELYARADEAAGFPLSRISFEGPEEELRQTRNTQPAILAHSVAVLTLLRESGLEGVAVAAGHSLGEYSALVASGALSFEDGLRLVRRRGELMSRAGEERPGTMAAVLGLEAEQVESICREAGDAGIVVPANLNAPGQIVISGEVEAVERAMELARSAGAKRVQRLEVSGAFHSPLMESAAAGLREALAATEVRPGRFPVIANVDAEPRQDPAAIRDALERQLLAPVRWVDGLRAMGEEGVDLLLEVGPRRVLSGLARRVLPDVPARHVEDQKTLEECREMLRGPTEAARGRSGS